MPRERTVLTPEEEIAFQEWARRNRIRDVDHPQSFYDYRGYWKRIASQGQDQTQMQADGLHFPDTFKQHGHPSFSVESQYAAGPWDAGQWIGEVLMAPPMASHRAIPPDVRNMLMAMMRRGTR